MNSTSQLRAKVALWPFATTVMLCCACAAQTTAPAPATNAPVSVVPPVFVSPAQKTAWKFSFGAKAAGGALLVSPTTSYSLETGYGFEPGTEVRAGANSITSDKPFGFSAAVPEGNYRVTVVLGDEAGESNTTVKAEARRLMLENISTPKGKSVTRSFTINMRSPKIAGGGSIGFKPNEETRPHWNEKLTLEFNGSWPSVASIEIAPEPNIPTVFLAGDSTVTDQYREPFAAWGQMFPRFFKPGIAVANYAESGLTLSSFRAQKRLAKILSLAKTGDWVLVQFGHNDQKDKGESAGPFKSYKKNLQDYVTKIRESGATPVLVTPMERRRWEEGKPAPTLADYAEAVRQVGTEEKVPIIDLNALSLKFYASLGEGRSKKAFAYATKKDIPGLTEDIKDNTHFSNYGAYELARGVVESIKTQVPTLAAHLSEDIAPFDPANPDALETFAVPASPYRPGEKPAGS